MFAQKCQATGLRVTLVDNSNKYYLFSFKMLISALKWILSCLKLHSSRILFVIKIVNFLLIFKVPSVHMFANSYNI